MPSRCVIFREARLIHYASYYFDGVGWLPKRNGVPYRYTLRGYGEQRRSETWAHAAIFFLWTRSSLEELSLYYTLYTYLSQEPMWGQAGNHKGA